MQTAENFDISTLAWVKGEIDETLKQARIALESYVEDTGDESQLGLCVTYIHQVLGTLKMVELSGAASFAEELEKLALAIEEERVGDRDAGYDLLMRGILQLPDYLESLLAGNDDNPIVLVPLINQFRELVGEASIDAAKLFNPNLAIYPPQSAQAVKASLKSAALKLRQYYQAALLKMLKGIEPAKSLKTIQTVFDKLDMVARADVTRQWVWVHSAFVEAIAEKGIALDKESKSIFGKIDQRLKLFAERDESAIPPAVLSEMTKGTLYLLSQASSSGVRVSEVREAFHLNLAGVAAGASPMGGMNAELKQTVASDIMEELTQVKDTFDVYVRSNQSDKTPLATIAETLGRIAETLAMLGHEDLQASLAEQLPIINSIVSGERESDESALMGIAGAVLAVESTLRDWGTVSTLEKADAADEQASASAAAEAEHQRVIRQVMKEAKDDLIKIRETVNNYVSKPESKGELEKVNNLFHQIIGSMTLLSYKRVAHVLAGCKSYINQKLLHADTLPAEEQLDLLADAMMSVEYYLEAFVQSRVHPGSVLEVAERAVVGLGFSLDELEGLVEGDISEATTEGFEVVEAGEIEGEAPEVEAEIELGAPEEGVAAEEIAAPVEPEEIQVTAVAAPQMAEETAGEAVESLEVAEGEAAAVEKPQAAPAAAAAPEVDEEIVEIFIEEAEEELDNLQHLLPGWISSPADQEALGDIRRSFHTLKGSGRLVGATVLGEFAWAFENMLNRVIDGTLAPGNALFDMLQESLQIIPQLIEQFSKGTTPPDDYLMLQEMAHDLAGSGTKGAAAAVSKKAPEAEAAEQPAAAGAVQAPETKAEEMPAAVAHEAFAADLDPVLLEIYSNEAETHIAALREYVEAYREGGSHKVSEPLIRALHTLQGSSRMAGVIVVADVAQVLEKYVKALQAANEKVTDAGVEALEQAADYADNVLNYLADNSVLLQPVAPLLEQAMALLAAVELIEEGAGVTPESGLAAVAEEAVAELQPSEEGAEVSAEEVEPIELVEALEAIEAVEPAEAESLEEQLEEPESLLLAEEEEFTPLELSSEEEIGGEIELAGEEEITLAAPAEEAEIALGESLDLGEESVDMDELVASAHPDSKSSAEELASALEAIELIDEAEIEVEEVPPEPSAQFPSPAEAEFETEVGEALEPIEPVAEVGREAAAAPVGPEADAVAERGEAAVAEEELPPPAEPTPPPAAAAAAVTEEYDPELLEIFLEEAEDILNESEQTLNEWVSHPDDRSLVALLQRQLHTLKGGARMAGVTPIGDLSHSLESTFDAVVDGVLERTPEMISLLQLSHDRLVTQLEQVRNQEPVSSGDDLVRRVEALSSGEVIEEAPPPVAAEPAAAAIEAEAIEAEAIEPVTAPAAVVDIVALEELQTKSNITLNKWAQAPIDTELLAALVEAFHAIQAMLAPSGNESINLISDADLRLLAAITDGHVQISERVKGLLEISLERIGTLAAELAKGLPVADDGQIVASINELIREGMSEEVGAPVTLEVVPPPPPREEEKREEPREEQREEQNRRKAPRVHQEMVRVRADILDHLVNNAGEVSIYRSRVEQQVGAFKNSIEDMEQTIMRLRDQIRQFGIETEAQIDSRYHEQGGEQIAEDFDPLEFDRFTTMQTLSRSMMESLSDLTSIEDIMLNLTRESETLLLQQARVNTEVQEGLMQTRMVPFSDNAPRFRRIVRQTAAELGKRANLSFAGAEVELDRNVAERIIAPLEHMLRNSISHGIEESAARAAAAKPEEGSIHVALAREGSEIVIRVTDDGAGINVEAVRKKAIERGMIKEGAKLEDKEVIQFILESGFSTAETLSQISGRGVGMDVVNSEIKQLGGVLEIDTERGKGSKFTIHLPLTLSVSRALLVFVGDDIYAIPLLSIIGIERLSHGEYQELIGQESPKYKWVDGNYDLHYLNTILGLPKGTPKVESIKQPLLLARSGGHKVAFAVDGILGSREIVVKSLGAQLSNLQDLAGATILADGTVALIVDVPSLIRRGVAKQTIGGGMEAEAAEAVARVPKVMVVDDSITVRKVTERLLKRNNLDCVTAKDGVDALAVLEEVTPDVMLLDIEMPRMDGYELATHIRNSDKLKSLPIIMITSRTGEKHKQRAMDIGVNVYMGKPYTEADLLENIHKLIDEEKA